MAVKVQTEQMDYQAKLADIISSMKSVIRGKSEAIELSMVALLAGGHLLVEDVPGVGKTMLALSLARSVECSYKRIQFTNDTIPADILGMMIYSRKEEKFRFVAGPIFAGIVLADEINRASPKSQSALLEAMTESKVSIENQVMALPNPFLVIATQNPSDHHGTFPLPESQLDRFLLRISMGYPNRKAEREILSENIGPNNAQNLTSVINAEEVLALREEVKNVRMDDDVLEYILELVDATRKSKELSLGVSPRGALMLKQASQALAYLRGRDYVLPDDVKNLVLPVWAHRIKPSGVALGTNGNSADTEEILDIILKSTKTPK